MRTYTMQRFPAREPLVSIFVDILGPLHKSKSGQRLLLVIKDRFEKLTPVQTLRKWIHLPSR